jgi:hypothetical protein
MFIEKYECKCGSHEYFRMKKGNATGLYCSKCGKWQKWIGTNENNLLEGIEQGQIKEVLQ